MAAPVIGYCLRRVSAQYPSRIFPRIGQHSAVLPCFANLLISNRHYAAKKTKRPKRDSKKKTAESEQKKKEDHYKFPLPSEPTDDVYLTWCYQKPVYEADVALDMLRKFQQLDFTIPSQHIYIDITLDMAMEKKKTVEQFVGALRLPYRFTDVIHKVVVFTENAEDAALARENGAVCAGGTELIKPILDGEIKADFYIAVPTITSRINPLRGTLKTKFPKTKNGSLGYDILQMLDFFKVCHEYGVESNNLIHTPIALLDMPNDQIVANLDAVIKDVCKYKPLRYGPFVTHLSIRSSTSESLDLKTERFLPEGAVKEEAKEEVKGGDSDSEEEVEVSR
ncbi:large ribosomal subunit protein uL1m isoform X2 [Rhineura floridana]|uniref:large ribosomal subunit protein uL1m isoform X2 n=1 Tax=Rhineura floridana TaxID=261503 RepID=UPI002AC81A5B|nr:large ribosomal subunit protein uL1m isoform X2 [Rhineura floridana]